MIQKILWNSLISYLDSNHAASLALSAARGSCHHVLGPARSLKLPLNYWINGITNFVIKNIVVVSCPLQRKFRTGESEQEHPNWTFRMAVRVIQEHHKLNVLYGWFKSILNWMVCIGHDSGVSQSERSVWVIQNFGSIPNRTFFLGDLEVSHAYQFCFVGKILIHFHAVCSNVYLLKYLPLLLFINVFESRLVQQVLQICRPR